MNQLLAPFGYLSNLGLAAMNLENLQILCRILVAVFAVLAVIAGFGDFYFGKQVDKQRRAASARDAKVKEAKLSKSFAGVNAQSRAQHEETEGSLAAVRDENRARHEELLRALASKEKSIEAQLWDRYPWGYVLFGTDRGDIVSLPVKNRPVNGKLLHVSADWENTKVEISKDREFVTVHVPNVDWHVDGSGFTITGSSFHHTQPLREGKSTAIAAGFYWPDEPIMFFEVLHADPDKPVIAIGFKKPSPGDLPPLPPER